MVVTSIPTVILSLGILPLPNVAPSAIRFGTQRTSDEEAYLACSNKDCHYREALSAAEDESPAKEEDK